jgi:hypothetical protein
LGYFCNFHKNYPKKTVTQQAKISGHPDDNTGVVVVNSEVVGLAAEQIA